MKPTALLGAALQKTAASRKKPTGGVNFNDVAKWTALGAGALTLGVGARYLWNNRPASTTPITSVPQAAGRELLAGIPMNQGKYDTRVEPGSTVRSALRSSGGFKDDAHFQSTLDRLAQGRGASYGSLDQARLESPLSIVHANLPPSLRQLGGFTVPSGPGEPKMIRLNDAADYGPARRRLDGTVFDPAATDSGPESVRTHEIGHASTLPDASDPKGVAHVLTPLDPKLPYHSKPDEIMAFSRPPVKLFRETYGRDPISPQELTEAADTYLKRFPESGFKEIWQSEAARAFFLENGKYIAQREPPVATAKVAAPVEPVPITRGEMFRTRVDDTIGAHPGAIALGVPITAAASLAYLLTRPKKPKPAVA